MYFTGIIIAVCTFLTIGIWHPIVIKTEYYWGTRPWVVYLVIGLASIMGALFIEIEEFYMLPQNGKLYKYDRMAINVIVDNIKGGLSFCDVAVSDDMETFNAHYLHLTETIRQTCQDILDDGAVIVGTSAVTGTELDSIVNQYSGIYTNPFLAWGRYRKGWLKTTLPVSFQFHHAQMDGSHAARFLEELQKTINTI